MLVVVGGHQRKAGKSSFVAALIRAMPEAGWIAAKITPHAESISDPPWILEEQQGPDPETDSGRFLAAGARRAFWLRTGEGGLEEGIAALRRILEGCENAVVESNSLLRFVEPDLYVVVLDPAAARKANAVAWADRVSAYVLVGGSQERCFEGKPAFPVSAPSYFSDELRDFLREKLAAGGRQCAAGRLTVRETSSAKPA